MALRTQPYDVADYLDSPEMISAYLTEELESEEPFYIAKALAAVARARGGMAQLAQETGIPEEELTAALSTGNPDLGTILKVLHAFGMKLSASFAQTDSIAA